MKNTSNNHIYGGVGKDLLTQFGSSSTLWGGEGDDKIAIDGNFGNIAYGNEGKDAFIVQNTKKANTVSGGLGNDVILFDNASAQVVDYHSGDGYDTVYGWTSNDKLLIDGSYSVRIGDSDVVVDVNNGSGSVRLVNAKGQTINVNGKKISTGDTDTQSGGGYTTNTDFVTLPGFWNSTKKIIGTAGNDSISNSLSSVFLDGLAGADEIDNGYYRYNGDDSNHGGSNVTIDGGVGNDSIHTSEDHATIDGEVGNDSIYNYGDNVIIYSGAGNDFIKLNSLYSNIRYTSGDGNDTVYGSSSYDTLQVDSDSYSTVKSGNDVIVKVGKGSIAMKDVFKNLSYASIPYVILTKDNTSSSSLPKNLSYSKNKTVITASKKFKESSIDLTQYSKVKTLNVSAVSQAMWISGNSLANSIKGGKSQNIISGGKGADTITGNTNKDSLNGGDDHDYLSGGAGADTLVGGKGEDVFAYAKSTGKDVITDYQAGTDKIKLTSGSISKAKISGKDVIFTVGKGTLTVKNGKGKKITVVDANGNLTIKKHSKNTNSNVSELWFAEENNFLTSDNLDAITNDNLTPTSLNEIETRDFTFTKHEPSSDLIAYSEK